jgi:hypothetical protein
MMVAYPRPRCPDSGERCGQHDRGGALQVVVEGAHLLGILVQNAPRVAGPGVLPVQHRVREQFCGRGDVGLDEIVVALVADPGVSGTQVCLVIEKRHVVGSRVQHHGEHPVWMYTCGGGVDRGLADRDLDAAHALITDAQDAL